MWKYSNIVGNMNGTHSHTRKYIFATPVTTFNVAQLLLLPFCSPKLHEYFSYSSIFADVYRLFAIDLA